MTTPSLRSAGLVSIVVAPVVGLWMAAPPAVQPPPSVPPVEQTGAARPGTGTPEYVIGNDDVLEVAVWDNVAMSRTMPVRPDGRISLPLINDVQAAGLTPMALQKTITKALEPLMQTPAVSVMVREVHSFKVSVIGKVSRPGRYEFTNAVTVLEALAVAGGLAEYADRNGIVVIRKDKMLPFGYERLATGRVTSVSQENFNLQPGDIVMVR
jgi:polysaccharide export outer membrane protein